MTGRFTLDQTEQAVAQRLAGLPVDHAAMAAVGGLYRAAGVVRNHLERAVLAQHDLTWTGWVVLWVVWVWDDIETRHAASEAGISKSTLTGVVSTLESRGLVQRRTHAADGRRVVLTLTPKATTLMETLFPLFNAQEINAVATLDPDELDILTRALRKIVLHLETAPDGDPRPAG